MSSVWVFLMVSPGLCAFGHHLRGIDYRYDWLPLMSTWVTYLWPCLSGFHYKVTIFSLPVHSVLFRGKPVCPSESREVCSTSWKWSICINYFECFYLRDVSFLLHVYIHLIIYLYQHGLVNHILGYNSVLLQFVALIVPGVLSVDYYIIISPMSTSLVFCCCFLFLKHFLPYEHWKMLQASMVPVPV